MCGGTPCARVPLGLRQTLIHATADPIVPLEMSTHYRTVARAAGDHRVTVKKIHGADHFDVITPTSAHWPPVFKPMLNAFETRGGAHDE